jgi:hypothetical protein
VERTAGMAWKVASMPLTREHKLHASETWAFHRGSQLQALLTLTSGKDGADQSDGRREEKRREESFFC